MLYLAFLPEALFSVGGSYLGGLYFWEASQETSLRQCAILVSNIHEVCQPVTVFFFFLQLAIIRKGGASTFWENLATGQDSSL